jgi:hypothetical protein
MEHLNLGRLDHDTGSTRTRVLGAALGLMGGLLFGGIVLPSRLITAPLTAVAVAAAAVLVENWLAANRHATFLPLRSAWIGGAAGLGIGVVVGLIAGAGYSALAFAHGSPPDIALQGLGTTVEIGAISALFGLIAGFGLGASEARG